MLVRGEAQIRCLATRTLTFVSPTHITSAVRRILISKWHLRHYASQWGSHLGLYLCSYHAACFIRVGLCVDGNRHFYHRCRRPTRGCVVYLLRSWCNQHVISVFETPCRSDRSWIYTKCHKLLRLFYILNRNANLGRNCRREIIALAPQVVSRCSPWAEMVPVVNSIAQFIAMI